MRIYAELRREAHAWLVSRGLIDKHLDSLTELLYLTAEREREALRKIVMEKWNQAAFGDGLDLSAIAHHVEDVLAALDARPSQESEKP